MKRIFHPWTAWECVPAGMYETTCHLDPQSAKEAYAEFLRDGAAFASALERVGAVWAKSCEHFLTNQNINRIAWLGQAAMCMEKQVPCVYRAGFMLLSPQEQQKANSVAQEFLSRWLHEHATKNSTVHQGVDAPGLFDRHTGLCA